jgi:hypothetical protein
MQNIYNVKKIKPKDIFKLIEELKLAFNDYVSATWSGNKKTSILTVKINPNVDIALVSIIRDLKSNTRVWDKLDVYTNKEGLILFEIKPYDFGYLELADFMKANKINTRCNVYNKREKIEYMYRSTKWIYYRFKETK